MIQISPLLAADHPRWMKLWAEYQRFYEVELPESVTDSTWQRILNGRIYGLAARDGDALVGIVHYLFHEDTWATVPACYLQDLYVDPTIRGSGCGRQLIEAVVERARQAGANAPYWLTHRTNLVARRLYDRLAKDHGFIQYIYTPAN